MHTFDTPAPISTRLDLPAGRLQLIAADRTDTIVEIRPAEASKGRDVQAAEQTTVTFEDGVLRIAAPAAKNKLFGSSGAVEVTVRLPAGSHLEATAAATELRGVGRLGNVAFDGAHRHTKLDEVAGIRLTATDGDVTVGRLNGNAEISTQRGDLRIAEATGGTLTLTTRSGDITVAAAPGVSAALDAGTTLGRVHNTLRNDGTTQLDVRATTTHGDITARSL